MSSTAGHCFKWIETLCFFSKFQAPAKLKIWLSTEGWWCEGRRPKAVDQRSKSWTFLAADKKTGWQSGRVAEQILVSTRYIKMHQDASRCINFHDQSLEVHRKNRVPSRTLFSLPMEQQVMGCTGWTCHKNPNWRLIGERCSMFGSSNSGYSWILFPQPWRNHWAEVLWSAKSKHIRFISSPSAKLPSPYTCWCVVDMGMRVSAYHNFADLFLDHIILYTSVF